MTGRYDTAVITAETSSVYAGNELALSYLGSQVYEVCFVLVVKIFERGVFTRRIFIMRSV